MPTRRAILAAALGTAPAALGLAACGRKAANLPPPDSTYPRIYPAPRVLDEPDDRPDSDDD